MLIISSFLLVHISNAAAAAKSLQSCLTLCDPIDGSPPGPAVPGILQARTLEWVAISSSNAWKWKVKVKSLSRVRLLATPWTAAYQLLPCPGYYKQCCDENWGTRVSFNSVDFFFLKENGVTVTSVQFSRLVMSDTLRPHGLQHGRPPCPSPTHRVYSNSRPLSWWCHPTISSSVVPFSSPFQLSQHQSLFKWVSYSHQVAKTKYWSFSFSISPSNEYSGLISFSGLVGSPCSPRDSQESSQTPQLKSINSSALSFHYGPTLTSVHDYWKNHSFD